MNERARGTRRRIREAAARLFVERGWSPAAWERWPADSLAAQLLP